MQANSLPTLNSSIVFIDNQHQLGLSNGAIFAVPIPEEYEAAGAELQAAVEQALQEAEENGVNRRGKEATPWLLKRVGELTVGKSLNSSQWLYAFSRFTILIIIIIDVALIKNTARVGMCIQPNILLLLF
jgi:pseudouridylate synthase / pseudouridine kinase